jgi:hypothetical protein
MLAGSYIRWKLNIAIVFVSDRHGPGLKAAIFGPFFRGLKPPAPSGSSFFAGDEAPHRFAAFAAPFGCAQGRL